MAKALPPARCPTCGRLEVRTIDQNARMWAMLTEVARSVPWPCWNGTEFETGLMSAEDWKVMLTAEVKRQKRMAPGISGGMVMLGSGTSGMTKEEMSDLMEAIAAFGAERNVTFKDPNDYPF